jgi:hypothetical protein
VTCLQGAAHVNNRGHRSQRRISRFLSRDPYHGCQQSTVLTTRLPAPRSNRLVEDIPGQSPTEMRISALMMLIDLYKRRSGEKRYRHIREVASNGEWSVAEYVHVFDHVSQSRCLMRLASHSEVGSARLLSLRCRKGKLSCDRSHGVADANTFGS